MICFYIHFGVFICNSKPEDYCNILKYLPCSVKKGSCDFCYMYDVLSYRAITVQREGFFRDTVQYEVYMYLEKLF